MEELEWHELDDYSPEKLDGADCNANDVELFTESVGLNCHTSDLNHSHLSDKGDNDDGDKEPVSENSFKDIEFALFKQSCVDLVKKLQENKNLEHQGVVKKFVSFVPFLEVIWSVHVVWIIDDLLSALLWSILTFPVLAYQFIKSLFVEVFWFKIL